MTAPHDTQRRGYEIPVCEKCRRAATYGFNIRDHHWACGGQFVTVEVAPVQSEGERDVSDGAVDVALDYLSEYLDDSGDLTEAGKRRVVRDALELAAHHTGGKD